MMIMIMVIDMFNMGGLWCKVWHSLKQRRFLSPWTAIKIRVKTTQQSEHNDWIQLFLATIHCIWRDFTISWHHYLSCDALMMTEYWHPSSYPANHLSVPPLNNILLMSWVLWIFQTQHAQNISTFTDDDDDDDDDMGVSQVRSGAVFCVIFDWIWNSFFTQVRRFMWTQQWGLVSHSRSHSVLLTSIFNWSFRN